MKPKLKFILFTLLLSVYVNIIATPLSREFFFQGSDHQVEVIRVKGEKPGLSVLIFGGIHGDEPGGYFSSEMLSRVKLKNGALIVVPRVNFPSIMLNRREVHGDMNRKFIPGEKPGDPDKEVIRLLKNLMKEADIFINQHDAYGFHREKYISKLYNPSRYGQSLIIDSAHLDSKKLGRKIHLAAVGKKILARVNRQIKNEKHHFGFWDHNSVSQSTKFPEMKKSATYYALTTHSIPAFGLETSKHLPTLNHKVKYQLLVIKEIIREFGLKAHFPPTGFTLPQLHWVEFLKNGKEVIRVNGNTNLRLNPGDKIVIKKINSNYDSGLSAHILNWGSINDMEKEYTFKKNQKILIKKNHMTIGKVYLKSFHKNSVRRIRLQLGDQDVTIPNWGKINLQAGQSLKIKGTTPSFKRLRVDVRGFQAPPGKRDDAHVDIFPKDLIKKYSFKKEGHTYFVKIYTNGLFAGSFQIQVPWE